MAHILADSVVDTTTTTGTGDVTLDNGAPTGYRTLNAVASATDTFPYTLRHRTLNEWETGIGTYSGSHVFVRTTVKQSSNANALVSFSAGTKDFVIGPTADPTFNSIELGHPSDATGTRSAAGRWAIEGSNLIREADVATQANQQTGTSLVTFVSPGRQHFHLSAAKAWVQFGTTGNIAGTGYNVSSVTDEGTGDATVNWGTDFADTNYSAVVNVRTGGSSALSVLLESITGASSRMRVRDCVTSALTDPAAWCVAGYGDHA